MSALFDDVLRTADISPDGIYRYRLTRVWGSLPTLPFIMLNPSTADSTKDDPTIRRCIGFAKREGFGGIEVCNLYAFRATKPADLWQADDPIGPRNGQVLRDLLTRWNGGSPIVAAWGAHAKHERVAWLLDKPGAHRLRCLGITKHGAPRHPLYVKGDQPLVLLDGGDPR